MTHVFVYGTLKSGESNSRLLKNAVFVGPAVTVEPYLLLDNGGFPVCFKSDTNARPVAGEVYEVSDEDRQSLDRLEGHPDFYRREEIVVDVGDTGVQHTVWMYFGNPEGWSSRPKTLPLADLTDRGHYVWSRQ